MATAEQIINTMMQKSLKVQDPNVFCKDEVMADHQTRLNSSNHNQQNLEQFSEVILFVDNREKRNQQDGNYLFDRLIKNGLTVEIKALPLGDFIWILRVHHSHEVAAAKETQGTKTKGTKKKGAP